MSLEDMSPEELQKMFSEYIESSRYGLETHFQDWEEGTDENAEGELVDKLAQHIDHKFRDYIPTALSETDEYEDFLSEMAEEIVEAFEPAAARERREKQKNEQTDEGSTRV